MGSRTLARQSGLSLSPASIRNVMADLEELGLVAAPHTSAGRVPTAKGYRLFVDTLVKLQPPRNRDLQSHLHGVKTQVAVFPFLGGLEDQRQSHHVGAVQLLQ